QACQSSVQARMRLTAQKTVSVSRLQLSV
ncbi:carbamoyl-phosphate synthase, large subunit, partial [Vibrio parahaemolyticus EKP-021]